MTRSYDYIFWVAVCLIPSFIIPSYTVFAYTQNLSSQITQLFVPLDLGNRLKIKCFNGSIVEFVSDCTSPKACQSLLDLGNNTLECIPRSKFGITSEQLILPWNFLTLCLQWAIQSHHVWRRRLREVQKQWYR
jgi:hypothetical protein